MPIFRVKSVKIYTGQKKLHGYSRGARDKYQVWLGVAYRLIFAHVIPSLSSSVNSTASENWVVQASTMNTEQVVKDSRRGPASKVALLLSGSWSRSQEPSTFQQDLCCRSASQLRSFPSSIGSPFHGQRLFGWRLPMIWLAERARRDKVEWSVMAISQVKADFVLLMYQQVCQT